MPHQHISAGVGYSLVIDPEGKVWSFGANSVGQLGLGDDDDRNIPTLIQNLPSIVSVAAGDTTSVVLDQDGRISVFGHNILRYFGIRSYISDELLNPVTIFNYPDSLGKIKTISVSLQDLYMLLDDQGQVFIFGALTADEVVFDMMKLERSDGPFPRIKDIVAGDTSLLLDESGSIWKIEFRRDENGDLDADIRNFTSRVPIKTISGADHFLLLDENGEVSSFGYNEYGQLGYLSVNNQTYPVSVPYLPPIKAVSAGHAFSAVLDENGHVWTCGYNESGELGHGDVRQRARFEMIPDLPPIVYISAGGSHLLLIDDQGQVWSCGNNESGELGRDTSDNSSLRPQVIPGLLAKLPPPTFGKFVRTTYPLIKLEELVDYRVQQSFPNGDVLMEFEYPDQIYVARVQHDVPSDEINPPLLSEEKPLFDELSRLIREEKLTSFQLRPDLYKDDEGNQALEFTDNEGQLYLIRVYEKNGEVFPLH